MDKKKIDRLLDNAEDLMRKQLAGYEEKRIKQTPQIDEKAAQERQAKRDKAAKELDNFLKENKMRLTKAQKQYVLDVDWHQFNGATELSVDLIKTIRKQYKNMQEFLDSGG